MNYKRIRAAVMLTAAALVWGAAMSFQSDAMNDVEPLTFQATRFLLGGTVLLPLVFFLGKEDPGRQRSDYDPKGVFVGGAVCGLFLMIACTLQQFGIIYTTVGKAGFLTSLYIIVVPIMGIFLKKRVGLNVWIGVVLALIGMYLLCMKESLVLSRGDTLVFICALVFSFQIMAIDKYAAIYNGLKLSCIQFYVCGILSAVLMLIFEEPSIGAILKAWVPVLYTGVFSCGIGYTFQTIAQKDLNPAVASIIMSLESVFAALFGWIILGQKMSSREIIGCVVMFAAIMVAQVFDVLGKKTDSE
ncbi:MAG: DMT family transporter [Ruminococcaceae bacterium]|nr:DMT family transporter [Oscillospiraceae bacterium]